MVIKDTIDSWRWRIVKTGHTVKTFSEVCGVSQSLLSQYMSGKANPSVGRFDIIEKTIRELEGK